MEFSFESQGTKLFGVSRGEGPVLVMLHGGMADRRAALPRSTLRCIGLSELPG